MNTLIHIGGKPVILVSQDVNKEIDIDELCRIDHSNLYGEIVTAPALLNKVGIWRAEAEALVAKSKLKYESYGAGLKRRWRVEANNSKGKFTIGDETVKLTEASLEEALLTDETYLRYKEEYIENQRIFEVIDSWFWAISDKSKKLSSIIKPTTPEEFYNELIEKKVNTFLIRKS